MGRLPVLGLSLLLAACSSEPATGDKKPSAQAENDDAIPCALKGAATFTRDCAVERAPQGDTLYLVVRHPDGAFRRFQVLKDGRGVAVADGADEAVTRLDGEVLEVAVGKDRYRFPATRRAHAPTS